jgi:putative transposon-encoded protein
MIFGRKPNPRTLYAHATILMLKVKDQFGTAAITSVPEEYLCYDK